MSLLPSPVFPVVDPVGPATSDAAVPHAEVVADVVAPGAAEADTEGVRRSTLDALAAAGLLGTALAPTAQRELSELLAGADASTWFCWVQHQTPLRTLEGSAPGLESGAPASLQRDLLAGMRDGSLVGAVAFAHVRRPGPPNPVATRVPGGWRLDGGLDWVTSWDVADVLMVMARGSEADSRRLVCAYLPAGRGGSVDPGMAVGAALDLLAMGGTHTRPVTLHGVVVPDARVGAVLDADTWLAADAIRTADANPAAFGVARGAIAELSALAEQRSDPAMDELADLLVQECRAVRASAYALADSDGPVPERLAVRAQSLDLATRAATAVVVARAGAAMRRGTSAERRVREAMFLQVQAQTRDTRAASLVRLAASSRRSLDGVL